MLRKVRRVRHREALKVFEEEARVLARYGQLRRDGAAHVIARAYRAAVIRHRLRYIIYWNHQEKALVIQRLVRGHLCRRSIGMLLAAKHELLRRQQSSSILIQAMARRMLARRVLGIKRLERERHIARRKMLKLMALQKVELNFNHIV